MFTQTLPPAPLPLQLTAGPNATWTTLPDMPYKRVLGDMVYLCDGTLLVTGGGERGIAVRTSC